MNTVTITNAHKIMDELKSTRRNIYPLVDFEEPDKPVKDGIELSTILLEMIKKALKKINSDGGIKKTAIISNTADYIVEYIVKKFNIESFFDEIFALSFDKDQAFAKPSPMGVHLILKKLNYDPKNSKALMIGDSIVDIYAAGRANIHACLLRRDLNKYPNGYDQWEYQPDYIIGSLDELFEL